MHDVRKALGSVSLAAAIGEMQKSNLALLLRSAQVSSANDALGPFCRKHPPRDVSPVERKWLEGKRPGDLWEPIPFNTCAAWRYKGKLNLNFLDRALEELLQRHSILRCTLDYIDGGWRYVDNRVSKPHVARFAASANSAGAKEEVAIDLGRFVLEPFDLRMGPLRIVVLEEEHLVLMVVHHAFTDMYSNRIGSLELALLYEAILLNQRRMLPSIDLSYFDFMASVDEWRKGEKAESARLFWRKYLRSANGLECERTEEMCAGGFDMDLNLSGQVRELCFSEKSATNLFWEAAHHVALYKLIGESDITTLSVDIGRRQKELIAMMGQFVNLLPLRSQITEDLTLREIIRGMQRDRRDSARYLSTPYDLIADNCSFSYVAEAGQLNYIPKGFGPIEALGPLPDLRLSGDIAHRIPFPYVIGVIEGNEFRIRWCCCICKPFNAAQFGAILERVVIETSARPDCPISKLRI